MTAKERGKRKSGFVTEATEEKTGRRNFRARGLIDRGERAGEN